MPSKLGQQISLQLFDCQSAQYEIRTGVGLNKQLGKYLSFSKHMDKYLK